MKRIQAVVKPSKLEHRKSAWADLASQGMTVAEVQRLGREMGRSGLCGLSEHLVYFPSVIKMETVSVYRQVKPVVKGIVATVKTDKFATGEDSSVGFRTLLRFDPAKTEQGT